MPIPTQLFIDLPNVLIQKSETRYFSIPTLLGHIDDHGLEGCDLRLASMYGFKYKPKTRQHYDFNDLIIAVEEFRYQLRGREVFVKTSEHQKDVDTFITSDIWRSCVRYYRRKAPVVRHILVSGDGDYLRSYEHIREEFDTALRVQLHVYSWRDQCSHHMKKCDSLVYLDDLPGIYDPMPESA